MIAADVTLLVSGVASLEYMLAKCLIVVSYRIKPITYWLIQRIIKITFISLLNLLSGKNLVKEFI
ncbi:MAG: hypothetical protein ArsCj_4190 [Arsenophonus endosymbiont of Ceratovacuna japonica]